MDCTKCGTAMVFKPLAGVSVCPACGHAAVPDDVDAEAAAVDARQVLEAALRFYARAELYEGLLLIMVDRGQVARDALAALEDG